MAGLKGKSGRKPRTHNRAATEALLLESAMDSVRYLQTVIRGKKKADPIRCEQCRYNIDQVIGRPKQRTEMQVEGELGITGDAIAQALKELNKYREG